MAGEVLKDGDVSFIEDFAKALKVKLVRVHYCFVDILRIILADANQGFTMDAPQISYCPLPAPVRFSVCLCTKKTCSCCC